MKKQNPIIRFTAVLFCACLLLLTVFLLRAPAFAEDEPVPDHSVPVVTVRIDESQGTIEEMLASPDHTVNCYGTVSIEVPEGFHYCDYPDLELKNYENLKMSIRGRGNSTWNQKDKKPFKIKLDKKEDIFGFGKNKHWVLLANAFDETLIRNRITYWLCEKLGFEFTPQGVPVDLVMVGDQYGEKYLGSYYLSENIRVDENRLDIGELEETDTEMPDITGGYLIQNARQVEEGSYNRFNTTRGEAWANDTPSFDPRDDGYENDAQKNYIRNHINTVEDAIYAGGEEYRELLDVESAADYWLINTLAMNLDAYDTGSTYIYKKRDVDGVTGKVYWGPVWDFDYAWDEGETYEGMSAKHSWMKPLFTDRSEGGFIEAVLNNWPSLKENAEYVIEDGGLLDQYYEEIRRSAENDRLINPDEKETGGLSYKENVEELRTWIRNRIDWLDANIASIDQMVHSITYIIEGETAAKDYAEGDQEVLILPLEPEKEGYIFTGWVDQDGNKMEFSVSTDHDLILTAQFIEESEAPQATDILFSKNQDVIQFVGDGMRYDMEWFVYPAEAYDRSVSFASSDESIAEVDESGTVFIHSPGTVIITVTAANGISKDFTLIITEDEPVLPKSIIPDHEVIHMTPGESTYITMHTEPALARIDSYEFASENPEIADAGFYGIVKANAVGTARIHIRSETYVGEETHTCDAYVTVIVSETPFVPEYNVVSGGNTEWQKGSGKEIVITVKRNEEDETCFSHFKGIEIDGKELAGDTDYTAASGSTVITLSSSCLKKLNEGEHTVTIFFDDGKAETKIIVRKADQKPAKAPDTGDRNSASVWISLMLVSLMISAIAFRFRYRFSK
ncbi:MAG: CotH kinase family protein [Erysipelotrichaceae bacterium]|nr:CotH kinase family protein [Erysipelotrichaceae bacterium]